MTSPDSDLLRRASAALREGRSGHNPGSGFTRARILNDLRSQRKKRSRWWRLGFPFGIILAGTTAWASSKGSWTEVWATMSHYIDLPLTGEGVTESDAPGVARRIVTSRSATAPAEPPVMVPSGPSEGAASAEFAPLADEGVTDSERPTSRPTAPEPDFESVVRVSPSASPQRHSDSRSPRSKPDAPSISSPNELQLGQPRAGVTSDGAAAAAVVPPGPLEAEISTFRQADDLFHKQGRYSAAVNAYRRYLLDHPSGRFVPEAQYNTALSLVRLGRVAEARPLLESFARGQHGTYRQEAARRLLEALKE